MACSNCTAIISAQDVFAGLIIFCVSFVGLVLTALIAATLIRHHTIARPFSNLCISLAAADCGVLTIFLFWCAPLTLGQKISWSQSFVGRKIGQLGIFFYWASLYTMLAVALNRLVAIAKYNKYKIWFNARRTRLITCLAWVLGGLHASIYFYPGCHFLYDPTWYLWNFPITECYDALIAIEVGCTFPFVGLIFTINLITSLKIRAYNSQIAPTGIIDQVEIIRRRRKEVAFFAQSCINAGMYGFTIVCFYVFTGFLHHKMAIFMATSFIWMASHCTNGVVLLAFNPELRRDLAVLVCCIKLPNAATKSGTNRNHNARPANQP